MGLERENVMLGTPAEKWYGYSQAVRVGDVVYVSGQTGVESHDGPQDLHGQMLVAYQRIAAVLAEVGLTLADVADEVVYVTDLAAAAHSTARRDSYGENVTVASTLIGVAAIGSAYRGCPALVEIKCVAARTEPAS